MLTIGIEPSLERQASEVILYWEGHWKVERQDVILYQYGWVLGGYSASSLDDRDSVSRSHVTTLEKKWKNLVKARYYILANDNYGWWKILTFLAVMSWSRDLSITWSRHVITHIIWSHDPDTWPTNFILTSKHHRFPHPRHHSSWHQVIIDFQRPRYDYVLVSFIIKARVLILSWTSSRCSEFLLPDPSGGGVRGGFPRSLLMKATEGLTSRSTPIQDPVVVVWEGSPWLLLIKATGGSHGEWWAVRLAGHSLSPTLEDVNISFNHSTVLLDE